MAQTKTQTQLLIHTVKILREKCAWTRALTHESLRTYLIEESYEVLDAISEHNPQLLKEELGDLYFQIVLHALIEEEQGQFGLEDISQTLNEKLLRRNRHIFDADGNVRDEITQDVNEIIRVWDAAKQAERKDLPKVRKNAGLPAALPSLTLAQKLLDRHSRAGSDKVDEQIIGQDIRDRITDEDSLANELLALTARAQELGLDAESVLRVTLAKRYGAETEATVSPKSPSKR
ncbi:MazG nucleotide pyrophosphohydrolase domain-containing protein [Glutamicibacter sp. JC586]|uniref:MazG nucleotide pyrophosphohydrolase domain-containing protein n=1 Tax=Glutamicibacter sp. JC586 TaxID=2590552 RepID=UPI001F3290A5|nr:MazG nucleotide pyrophosphohydrolase domain-containing protein [Glutamicibacter sp. JC586]